MSTSQGAGCWRLHYNNGLSRWELDGNNGQIVYGISAAFSCTTSNVFDIILVNNCPGPVPATVTVQPVGNPNCDCVSSSSSSASSASSMSTNTSGTIATDCCPLNLIPAVLHGTLHAVVGAAPLDGLVITINYTPTLPAFGTPGWSGTLPACTPTTTIELFLRCGASSTGLWTVNLFVYPTGSPTYLGGNNIYFDVLPANSCAPFYINYNRNVFSAASNCTAFLDKITIEITE